jgi:NADH:ubiquinone oxidoreductase subunit 5 (subunit L)/multisubunit Na+/H+ antiporter MnhA subunit
MNRIADIFLIFSIAILLITYNITEYVIISDIIYHDVNYNKNFIVLNFSVNKFTLICSLLLMGAIGKSAQIGLHTWLPDAMEGPTPVSSLLHAATMVTAGIFLILRCSFLIDFASDILLLVILAGGFTAFSAAIIAIFQYDIKRIIAYSTCSQLGYMFLSCGFSLYDIAIFHLFNHAFFKALLFLSAGSVIHSVSDEQDFRRMGNLRVFLPLSYVSVLVGSLAIIGFPYLTGFYSKDLLFELLLHRFVMDSLYIYVLAIATAFCTSIYSARLVPFVFFINTNNFRVILLKRIVKYSYEMFYSLLFLSLFTIFIGFICSDIFVGYGSYYWNNSLSSALSNAFVIENNFTSPALMNLLVILGIMAIFLCIGHYVFDMETDNYSFVADNYLYSFIYNAFFFNTIYNSLFMNMYMYCYYLYIYIDRGFLEYFGPYGLYNISFMLNGISIQKYIASNIFWMFILFILLCSEILMLHNEYLISVNGFVLLLFVLA